MSLKESFIECVQAADPQRSSIRRWDGPGIKPLLDNTASKSTNKSDLISQLLRQVVRPAFSKNRNKDVTAQGRRAMESWQPTKPYDSDEIRASKPWRYGDKWVVSVFDWCLESLNETSVEEYWPMLMPPILAHTDDDKTDSRVKGCSLLRKLLSMTPSAFLAKTGLGEVFEQALLPNLTHIPPAFEEAESLHLLGATYPTLLQLTELRFPGSGKHNAAKQKCVDRILRQGIFTGLGQLKEEVAVSRLLLQQLNPFLKTLGIFSVKHLKTMIPLVSVRLNNPFATAAAGMMKDAALAMRAIMIVSRPRVLHWRLEILESFVIPWLRILEEDHISEDLSAVKAEIQHNLTILHEILADSDNSDDYDDDDSDACAQVARILQSEDRLAPLLEIWSKPGAQDTRSAVGEEVNNKPPAEVGT